ncbi:hypothetical protein RS85_01657 [Microbacterium sp. SA39]|nr:hypothetical protein RS85_01657 [Microbacterium sp. SA39]
MDVRVSAEMTEVSNAVLAGRDVEVYDAMMDGTGRLLDLVEVGVEGAGGAYLLWSEICDRWELADGPEAVAAVPAEAREVAREWLEIDRSLTHEVETFFGRRLSRVDGSASGGLVGHHDVDQA